MNEPTTKRVLWGEIIVDLVGLGSLAAVCAGVYLLWGPGWTLIAGGLPLFSGYAWREARIAARPRRRK